MKHYTAFIPDALKDRLASAISGGRVFAPMTYAMAFDWCIDNGVTPKIKDDPERTWHEDANAALEQAIRIIELKGNNKRNTTQSNNHC